MRVIARLVVRSGGGSFFLRPGRFVVGRGSDCDLVLGDVLVSRRHAVIELDETSATLSDVGSRNGTRVDGRTIDRTPLANGSVVQIGSATCVFEWLDREPDGDDQQTPAMPVAPGEREPALTVAERRVLTCLVRGLSEKVIAAELSISPHTVHNHTKRIYAAYRVNSRAELLSRFIPR
jgi:pSer/pThr/pTyr-binding forkhead associated (FHA) protein